MLDKQVSWLFLCWNMILLGSFYKHLIFICLSRHTVKKRLHVLPIFLKYLSSLFIDLKIMLKI
jgi:hypothetical protein